MNPKSSLTLTTTLPCGCEVSLTSASVAGYEGMFYFMKYAAEALMHFADAKAETHQCEGGHAD